MQMHFPMLLPDESLYNLAARFARLNGYWNHLSATKDLIGNAKAASIANCPISYEANALENLHLYGDEHYIQHTLTTRLLARHLGEQSHSNINATKLQPARHPDKSSIYFLESIYGLNPHWRVCPECARQNSAQYSVNYWQRTHQMPTSIVCYMHGTALIESNLPRKQLHDHLWLPSESPIKPKDSINYINTHWRMIAQVGHDGLQDKSEAYVANVIKQTILLALRYKGLTTNQNKLLISKFNASFDEFFGVNFRHEMRVEIGIKNPTVLLKGIVNEMNANALYRIILVYWLFGSWEFFKESCKWLDIFSYAETAYCSRQINKVTCDEDILNKARKACLAYVNESIHPTRNEFNKSHYRDFNWLLRHDRAWLDKMLPIIKTWKQRNIFGGF